MHKSATKCIETLGKWCKNKHGASKIIDTFETYHMTPVLSATPWITYSTIVQNIVIIADSVIYYNANPDTQVFKTLQK
jgi:hypothetical protein